MTIGEDRVRIKFNPSGDGLVNGIKQMTAKLIDACEEGRQDAITNADNGEVARCWALAMTHYEDAAMWAVKAATADK
jgi:hypothetical protein